MLDFDQLLNRECRLAALALCLEIARARQRREGHTCPEYVLPSAHRASSWFRSPGEAEFMKNADRLPVKGIDGRAEHVARPPIKKFRITILPQPDRAKT